MVKALLAASAVALFLGFSPASAALGPGLSSDPTVEFSPAVGGMQKIDFLPGHAAAPLDLRRGGVDVAAERAEAARYDGFNAVLTLLTLLAATGVFVAACLAAARRDDERLASEARREEDRHVERSWEAEVMRALEAELLNIDRVATRRAA